MKPSREEELSTYYKEFEPGGKGVSLEFLLRNVESNPGKFQELFTLLKSPGALNITLIGSAATENLQRLSNFLDNHGPAPRNDQINLVDINQLALEKAKPALPKNKTVSLIQAEMNALPLPKESSDLVIADFTLQFNPTMESLGHSLRNISRVLKNNGLFLGTIVTRLESGAVTDVQNIHFHGQPFNKVYFPYSRLMSDASAEHLFQRGDVKSELRDGLGVEGTAFLMEKLRPKESDSNFSYIE